MKQWLFVESVILVAGSVFTLSKLYIQVSQFLFSYGTLFRFNHTILPNPLLTACFYGTLVMTIAAGWSLYILYTNDFSSHFYLLSLVCVGIVFAAGVVGFEFYVYFFSPQQTPTIISCSPGVHPLSTPCFIGLLAFMSAGIVAALQQRQLMKL